jgi:hypothetical protein
MVAEAKREKERTEALLAERLKSKSNAKSSRRKSSLKIFAICQGPPPDDPDN